MSGTIVEFHRKSVRPPKDRGKQAAKESLEILLRRVQDSKDMILDAIDDALFKFAESAGNNHRQTLFLDSVRTLRLFRDAFFPRFQQEMEACMGNFWECGCATPKGDDSSSGELSLKEKEDLEEEIAVQTFARKLAGATHEELVLLNRRFHFLLKGEDGKLPSSCNPLGPEAIGASMKKVAFEWEAGVESKVVFYRYFEKHLAAGLADTYREANQIFAKIDVLPGLTVHQALRDNRKDARGAESEGRSNITQDDMKAAWRNLRERLGDSMLVPAPAAPDLPVMPRSAVLDALSAIHGEWLSKGEFSNLAIKERQGELRSRLLKRLGFDDPKSASCRLDETEHQILDMVLAVFNKILDEPLLSDRIKAEIGRLQIPVLKLAIVDQGFVNDPQHPSRVLIDRLVEVDQYLKPMSMEAKHKHANELASLVSGVIKNDAITTDTFRQAVEKVNELLSLFQKRWRNHETHAIERAKGEDRREQAERAVQQILEEIDADALPNDLYHIVAGPWKTLMVVSFLKEGRESRNFQGAAEVARALCSLASRETFRVDPNAFAERMDQVVSAIGKGLSFIGLPRAQQRRYMRILQRYQDEGRVPLLEKRGSRKGAGVESQDRKSDDAFVNDEYDKMAENLSEGEWISVRDSENGEPRILKLSWKSSFTRTFLFVDGAGNQILKLKQAEVAAMFRDGRASISSAPQQSWISAFFRRLVGR